jgi:membrane protein DedA with SNARE-associated domain
MTALFEQLSGFSHWQIDLIAFWLLLQGAFFSIAPEEIVIITLGVLWGHGQVNFIEAIISIMAGLLPANLMMVKIGERVSRNHTDKKSVKIASDYLSRYGAWVVFLTRFTPLIRGPVYFSVGASRYGFKRFIQIDWLAACIQVPALLIFARNLSIHWGDQTQSLSESLNGFGKTIGWAAGGLLALTLALTIALETRRRFTEKSPSLQKTREPLPLRLE